MSIPDLLIHANGLFRLRMRDANLQIPPIGAKGHVCYEGTLS